MTTTFMEPETIDIPVEIVDKPECTAGHAWCNGDCTDDVDGDEFPKWENDRYHAVVVAELSVLRFTGGEWVDAYLPLLVRHDENEGDVTRPLIMVDTEVRACQPAMTAEQARRNAAWLLNAADLLDPLPPGVVVTTAAKLRIGDELLTEDGWQEVIGLMLFADTEQAHAFTPECHPDSGIGWDFSFNDPVKVRRPLTGSCAIQFVEPIR